MASAAQLDVDLGEALVLVTASLADLHRAVKAIATGAYVACQGDKKEKSAMADDLCQLFAEIDQAGETVRLLAAATGTELPKEG